MDIADVPKAAHTSSEKSAIPSGIADFFLIPLLSIQCFFFLSGYGAGVGLGVGYCVGCLGECIFTKNWQLAGE